MVHHIIITIVIIIIIVSLNHHIINSTISNGKENMISISINGKSIA